MAVFHRLARSWPLIVLICACVHAALLLHVAWRKSPTVDEVAHLPAGVTYWQKRTFALYHHNPPLVKLLAALPVLAAGPDVDYSRSWARNRARGLPVSQWNFGWEFMERNAARYRLLYFLGRTVAVLFACTGLVFTALLAARLFGPAAAAAAAALWCAAPNLAAHGALITTDVPAAALAAASVYMTLRWSERPTWGHMALLGFVLGLAQLTKFTLLLLYLLLPVLSWVYVRSRKLPGSPARRIGSYIASVLISVLVINAGYFFEGTGKRLGNYQFVSALLTRPRVQPPQPGEIPPGHPWAYILEIRENRFRGTWLDRLPVPLPEHYVLGFDEQRLEAEGLPGPDGRQHGYYVYLFGQLRDHGWWYYYFVALAVKLPLGTLGLLAIAPLAWYVSGRWNEARTVLLAAAACFVVVMSLATDINLGVRYVLPGIPFLLVLVSELFTRSGWIRWFAAGCLLWNAAAVARIHPHYLAYFNELAGGPEHGHAILIDSNIDWGQDLYELAEWLRTHRPGQTVRLAYFGNVDPAILEPLGLGFPYVLAPPRAATELSLLVVRPDAPLRDFLIRWSTAHTRELTRWREQHPEQSPLEYPELKRAVLEHLGVPEPGSPGLYAISVNFLRRLPFRLRDQQSNLWDFARFPDGQRGDPYSYMLRYRPVARIGYSIYVFELD